MQRDLKKNLSLLLLLCGLVVYSLAAFAYLHEKFVSKDVMSILIDDVRYIRGRVDEIGKRK